LLRSWALSAFPGLTKATRRGAFRVGRSGAYSRRGGRPANV